MDILEKAINFAKDIRKTKENLNLENAKKKNDGDKVLQNMINEFNLLKLKINYATSKSDLIDQKKVDDDRQNSVLLSNLYDEIMKNKNMIEYNNASEKMDLLMNKINKILLAAVNGKMLNNVDELISDEGCSGNCSGCSGCF